MCQQSMRYYPKTGLKLKKLFKEKIMKSKSQSKPVKKSPMPSRPVKPSYEEPMRPKKPNTTSKKK